MDIKNLLNLLSHMLYYQNKKLLNLKNEFRKKNNKLQDVRI